jgi:hypothetical protein
MTNSLQTEWNSYVEHELRVLTPLLLNLGFELEAEQPHVLGERFLIRAATTHSGKKLILLGARRSDGRRVVIKTSSDKEGVREIEHEELCRDMLDYIPFAYEAFLTPEEILNVTVDGRRISIQAFIEQERPYALRSIEEQFTIALAAFKAQERVRATTLSHFSKVASVFGVRDVESYLATFNTFVEKITTYPDTHEDIKMDMRTASSYLRENKTIIDQYSGFLTHTDFVPHNFRLAGDDLYLLDHSALRFGNKYEGWARFLNYMSLYNPCLERALMKYVGDNRTKGEVLSLKLMRLYRLGEIIWYYMDKAEKSEEKLRELNRARVTFWGSLLHATLRDKTLTEQQILAYQKTRDALRSSDEITRQNKIY